MEYQNLDNYDPLLAPFLLSALEEREKIEISCANQIDSIIRAISHEISVFLLYDTGGETSLFKAFSEQFLEFLEEQKRKLSASYSLIFNIMACRTAACALSPIARLQFDYDYFLEDDRITGNLLCNYHKLKLSYDSDPVKIFGELKEYDLSIFGIKRLSKIQNDLVEEAEGIAKHTIEKQELFNGKEFKISSKLWDIANNNIESIKKIISAGINTDCGKVAKALETYTSLGFDETVSRYPNMMKRLGHQRIPKNLSFNAFRLARNELAEIYFRTSLKSYLENPFVEACKWLLANNRLKQYEDKCSCNDIAYMDVYGLGRGVYPLDKVPDRPHVMCLCTTAPLSSKKLKQAVKDGMKLGNIPSKDWQNSQKEELNKQLIKKNYEKTGLIFLTKKDGAALKQAGIEIIKDMPWFNNSLKKEHRKAFIEDLQKVNSRAVCLIARFAKDLKVDFYSKTGGSFRVAENKIYCDLLSGAKNKDNTKAGYKLGMKNFLHKMGHFLDYNMDKGKVQSVDRMKSFFNRLALDVRLHINAAGARYNVYMIKNNLVKNREKDLFKLISDLSKNSISNINDGAIDFINKEFRENKDYNSGISDIYSALTFARIAGLENGLSGHIYKYWQRDNPLEFHNKVCKEAFALAFEAMASQGNRGALIWKELPLAWKYFNKELLLKYD